MLHRHGGRISVKHPTMIKLVINSLHLIIVHTVINLVVFLAPIILQLASFYNHNYLLQLISLTAYFSIAYL